MDKNIEDKNIEEKNKEIKINQSFLDINKEKRKIFNPKKDKLDCIIDKINIVCRYKGDLKKGDIIEAKYSVLENEYDIKKIKHIVEDKNKHIDFKRVILGRENSIMKITILKNNKKIIENKFYPKDLK